MLETVSNKRDRDGMDNDDTAVMKPVTSEDIEENTADSDETAVMDMGSEADSHANSQRDETGNETHTDEDDASTSWFRALVNEVKRRGLGSIARELKPSTGTTVALAVLIFLVLLYPSAGWRWLQHDSKSSQKGPDTAPAVTQPLVPTTTTQTSLEPFQSDSMGSETEHTSTTPTTDTDVNTATPTATAHATTTQPRQTATQEPTTAYPHQTTHQPHSGKGYGSGGDDSSGAGQGGNTPTTGTNDNGHNQWDSSNNSAGDYGTDNSQSY